MYIHVYIYIYIPKNLLKVKKICIKRFYHKNNK